MKRKGSIISLIGLTFITAIGAVSSTVAWLSQTTFVSPTSFFAKTDGAYFAYGDGSATNPFGLNSPRHLYNLSWLNMMGYFKDKAYYFEIDPNVENGVLDGKDASGQPTVIPPIGTEKYPFMGSFNGRGMIISNFVISTKYSDYTQKPYNADSIFSQPQIVGLFGVIGSIPNSTSTYTYSGEAPQLYNTGISNLTIKTSTDNALIGIVAGYANGPIKNVAVNASSIDIASNTSGAVDGTNFTSNLSDYGIIGYCATSYTQDQTNYNKKDLHQVSAEIYSINTQNDEEFNAHEKGESSGSGASLDMKKMYNNLHENWAKFVAGNTYKAKYPTGSIETITDRENKVTIDDSRANYQNTYNNFNKADTACYANQGSGYHSYYNYTQSDGTNQTASYAYIIEPYDPYRVSSYTGLAEEAYMCLTGTGDNEEIVMPNSDLTYNNINSHYQNTEGHYIYYRNGTTNNYLTRGVTNLNSTNSSNASLWYFSSTGHFIETIDPSNDTIYYLNCNASGALSITTDWSTFWYYDSSRAAYYTTVSDTTYYLGFDGTRWATASPNEYYLIHSGNNYATHNGTGNQNNLANTNSATRPTSTNTRWYLDSNNRFRTTKGGNLYLSYRSNAVRPYNNTSNAMVYNGTTNEGDNTGTITYNSSRYLRYNNGWTSSNYYSYTVTVTKVVDGFSVEVHPSDIKYEASGRSFYYKESTLDVERSKIKLNPTYFPLKGDLSGDNLTVNDANTGYVVSGSNYKTASDPYGDIRVSAFNVSDLSNSYTSGSTSFKKVYTYDGETHEITLSGTDAGKIQDTNKKFQRFVNSSAQMLNTLSQNNDAGKIYGLHFMDAVISTSNLVEVPYAKVADKDPKTLETGEKPYTEYTNFEMPEDSIDFHFKENGIINFFAGTYYDDNDAFFSLHQIERYKSTDTSIPTGKKANDIKSIKEIDKIYENTQASTKVEYPYVYTYDGGSSSVGTKGDLLFDTAWIANPNIQHDNAAYYFEIPANKGEYALGAVGGKKGAYLMYLDLGANANKIARTEISEHFISYERVNEYPIGVAFVDSFTKQTVNGVSTFVVDELNSGNIVVPTGFTGKITLTRSSDTITASFTNSSNKNKVGAGYHKDTITMTDGTSTNGNPNLLKELPKEEIVKEVKRIQLFDYGIIYLTMTRTVVEQTTTTHAYWGEIKASETATTQTLKQYVYDASGALTASYTTPAQESSIKAYNPNDATLPGQPYTDPKAQIFALYSNDNTSTIYKIAFTVDEGITVTLDYDIVNGTTNLFGRQNEASFYYKINGYNVLVSLSKSGTVQTVTITVVEKSTSYTFYINGGAANSGTVDVDTTQPPQP